MSDADKKVKELTAEVGRWRNRAVEMAGIVCVYRCGGICKPENREGCRALRVRLEAETGEVNG